MILRDFDDIDHSRKFYFTDDTIVVDRSNTITY